MSSLALKGSSRSLCTVRSDGNAVAGVELYDYRKVNMSNFDEFDRVNVAGQAGHENAQAELAAALRAHFNDMR